jgi:hypothetical protein
MIKLHCHGNRKTIRVEADAHFSIEWPHSDSEARSQVRTKVTDSTTISASNQARGKHLCIELFGQFKTNTKCDRVDSYGQYFRRVIRVIANNPAIAMTFSGTENEGPGSHSQARLNIAPTRSTIALTNRKLSFRERADETHCQNR